MKSISTVFTQITLTKEKIMLKTKNNGHQFYLLLVISLYKVSGFYTSQ